MWPGETAREERLRAALDAEPAAVEGKLPASIAAHVRAPLGDVRTVELARCGFHPTVIARRVGAEDELRVLLAVPAGAPARA